MQTTPINEIHYAIGIMSGTSVDGIDAAVLEIRKNNRFSVVSTNSVEFTSDVQTQIRQLSQSGRDEIQIMGSLDTKLAQLYFEAIKPLIHGDNAYPVSVIGCHGQTIRHQPDQTHPFTLQIGNGAALAYLSNLPVVSDFRSADIAAGGQGAPLTPAFHHAAFASTSQHRAIINIGGIGNLTHLPTIGHRVTGFDTGPGNTLLDHWIRSHLGREFDKDAEWAKQGTAINSLLELLLSDPYFDLPAPKSTGLEYFNLQWLQKAIDTHNRQYKIDLSAADVQATLASLTARTITDQLNRLQPQIGAAYVCGGGANNPLVMKMLSCGTSVPLSTTSNLGVDPQWVEAAAFAWMAHRTLHRLPSTLPFVTGAHKPTIAGGVYFP